MVTERNRKIWRSQLRIPMFLIDYVKGRADDNCRSLNAEVVELIREAKSRDDQQAKSA